jgi:predicted alpha/beta-hydrolase family hydrolase
MLRKSILSLLFVAGGYMPCMLQAQGTVSRLPTRPNVFTTLFWEPAAGARGTVFLFPGGAGGFGRVENGKALSKNFLVRSSAGFVEHGFNVAIFGRPSDFDDLDFGDRISEAHMADVRKILDDVKMRSPAPIWIVGTSRGTISAAAMASRIQDPTIAGLVLTASIVNVGKPGALTSQDLSDIRVPVLLYHHAMDACAQCRPADVPSVMQRLIHAPVKKLMFVDKGANPSGEVCGAQHWHGFIGMEKQAIDEITTWMAHPID